MPRHFVSITLLVKKLNKQASKHTLTEYLQSAVPLTCKNTLETSEWPEAWNISSHTHSSRGLWPESSRQSPQGTAVLLCPASQEDQLTFGAEVTSGRCSQTQGTTWFLYVLYLPFTMHRAPQLPMEAKKIEQFIK